MTKATPSSARHQLLTVLRAGVVVRLASRAACLAILLNLLLPVLLGLMPKPVGQSVQFSICSSTGLRTLATAVLADSKPAAGAAPADQPTAAHAKQHCPICSMGHAFVPPNDFTLRPPDWVTSPLRQRGAEPERARQRRAWAQLPSRAPPRLA